MTSYLQNFFLLFFIVFSYYTSAQISSGGTPYTLGSDFQKYSQDVKSLETYALPQLDMGSVFEEDKQTVNTRRFAKARLLNLSPQNSGKWIILDNGDRVWRIKISSEGALGLRPIFDKFYLPKGAKMFVYDENGQHILGAFTSRNNKKSGKFTTMFVKSDVMIIEYYEPKSVKNQGKISIWRVDHAYRNINPPSNNNFEKKGEGFQDSGSCNINVNCPLGDDWQDEKRGIVRIILTTSGGADHCTGSLINNTAEDNRPLFLTADHCGGSQAFVDTWGFIFNYESVTCSNPSSEPSTAQSIIGATILSNNSTSDFFLVELSTDVPISYNAYFNGWDKSGNNENGTIGIHHPSGDIKKISEDADLTSITTYLSDTPTSSGTHFRVIWEEGTTEGGSSGSPLFNLSGNIIGQLHGGFASCSNTTAPDWYGRISVSWNGGGTSSTRLSDWLDPTGSGVTSLNGKNNEQFTHDVSVENITTSASDCEYSASTPIEIEVLNNGTANQNNIDVEYELRRSDNSLVASNTLNITTLNSNESTTLNLNLDLSETGETYTLTVEAILDDGITDESTGNNTNSASFTTIQVITNYPYNESFESGTDGWTSNGVANEWELGQPNDAIIDSASDGVNAWVTDLNGDYSNNADNYLLSPVFNLATMTNVQFSADIFINLENNYDGVQLQASTDCGVTWETVGTTSTGTNWYNNSSGLLPFNDFGDIAWSGEETSWESISHSLSDYDGESQLQLRFLFRSDISEVREGFGVDNISITGEGGTPIPIINLSGDLAFGNVTVNTSSQKTLNITNTGSADLTVSSISLPTGYSGNWSSGVIGSGSSQNITITFSPTTVQSYNGTITVNSDATSGTNTIAITGAGVEEPPTSIEDILIQNIKVYPNPTTNYFILDISKNLKLGNNFKMNIYSSQGKLVSHKNLNLNKDDLLFKTENFEKGTYLLEIITNKGTITKRLIIE